MFLVGTVWIFKKSSESLCIENCNETSHDPKRNVVCAMIDQVNINFEE